MTTQKLASGRGTHRGTTRLSAPSRARPAPPRTRPQPARPRLPLPRRARQAVLLAHLAAAGAWLGADLVMAVLVGTAVTGGEAERAVAYLALQDFVLPVLVAASLAALATGLLLGLGTRYGLVRYWWVAVKLVVTVVLVVLVQLALAPQVADLAGAAELWRSGGSAVPAPGDLVFPPVVSTAAVLGAYVLSVLKPWGRVRGRRGQAARARAATAKGEEG